jgi:hypothetical protein
MNQCQSDILCTEKLFRNLYLFLESALFYNVIYIFFHLVHLHKAYGLVTNSIYLLCVKHQTFKRVYCIILYGIAFCYVYCLRIHRFRTQNRIKRFW